MVRRGIAFDPSKLIEGEDGDFDTAMPTGGNLRDSRMPDGSMMPALTRDSRDASKLRQTAVNLFRELAVHETQEAGGKAPA